MRMAPFAEKHQACHHPGCCPVCRTLRDGSSPPAQIAQHPELEAVPAWVRRVALSLLTPPLPLGNLLHHSEPQLLPLSPGGGHFLGASFQPDPVLTIRSSHSPMITLQVFFRLYLNCPPFLEASLYGSWMSVIAGQKAYLIGDWFSMQRKAVKWRRVMTDNCLFGECDIVIS